MPLTVYHEEAAPLDDDREGTPFDARNVRTYTKRFRVVMTSNTHDAIVVCACPGLPYPYSSYYSISDGNTLVYDLYALMIRMTAKTDHDRHIWIVTCEYSTEMPAGGQSSFPGYPATVGGTQGGGAANNPELEPPDISFDSEVVEEARPTDLDGFVYDNSAGQPFTPAHTTPTGYQVLSYTRNELNFNMAKARKWTFAVNSKVFLGAPVGSVRIEPITGKITFRGPLRYARVSYKFKFKPTYVNELGEEVSGTWQPRLLDTGLSRLQLNPALPNFGKPVPIVRFGAIISQPVLLDGAGQELDLENRNGNNPLNIKAVYRNFRDFQARDFNQLLVTGVS